jgi:hypothetical protein
VPHESIARRHAQRIRAERTLPAAGGDLLFHAIRLRPGGAAGQHTRRPYSIRTGAGAIWDGRRCRLVRWPLVPKK